MLLSINAFKQNVVNFFIAKLFQKLLKKKKKRKKEKKLLRPQLEPTKAMCAPNRRTSLSVELDQCAICPVAIHSVLLLKSVFAISDICVR